MFISLQDVIEKIAGENIGTFQDAAQLLRITRENSINDFPAWHRWTGSNKGSGAPSHELGAAWGGLLIGHAASTGRPVEYSRYDRTELDPWDFQALPIYSFIATGPRLGFSVAEVSAYLTRHGIKGFEREQTQPVDQQRQQAGQEPANAGAGGANAEQTRTGEDAPVVARPASADTGVVSHSTKTKGRDVLHSAIDVAKGKCIDPTDTAQVMAQMEALAQNEHLPLLAATKDGIKYTKNGENAYLTRDALDKRLHPENRQKRR